MTLSHNVQKAYDWFAGAPLHIVVIIVIALLLQKIGARAITRGLNRIADADFVPGPRRGLQRQRERAKTAGTVLRSAMNGTIFFSTSLCCENPYGTL